MSGVESKYGKRAALTRVHHSRALLAAVLAGFSVIRRCRT